MATNGCQHPAGADGFNYLFRCGASYETYGYCDPEMDKWLIVGLRVRDPERRAQAYAMAQRAVLRERALREGGRHVLSSTG